MLYFPLPANGRLLNGRVNGKPTYLLVLDRPKDRYHAEIIVDSQTSLPIEANMRVHYDGPNGGNLHYRQTYRFNEKLDPDLFAFRTQKPVINLDDAEGQLRARWRRPLGMVGRTRLMEASVTPDGTIWIATMSEGLQRGSAIPAKLKTPQGFEYTRLDDIGYGEDAEFGGGTFRIDGQEILVAGFVPLVADAPIPTHATLRIFDRPGPWADSDFNAPTSHSAVTLTLTLRREPKPVPVFFPLLKLDDFTIQSSDMIWFKRAQVLQGKGRFLEAARAFERTAREYENFVKYMGYVPLEQASDCYQKLGMTVEAARDRDLAKQLQTERER